MNIENFLFGIYPYIALSIFFLGSLIRFDRDQYSWKSDSSQLLSKKYLRLGSNLFHVGILAIFGGHLVGLLTPHGIFLAPGVSDMTHQIVAIVAGSIFGVIALFGALILWFRRMLNKRVSKASRKSDKFILSWLLITLIIGLSTIPVSFGHYNHGDPSVMILLSDWVKSIVTFNPQPELLANVDTVFKIHMFFGLTVFLVFPFTRLVHIWSAPFTYLNRPHQVVRSKRKFL
jgi:nitrate reductase gamma subunit